MISQNKILAIIIFCITAAASWLMWRQNDSVESFMPSLTYKIDKVYDASAPYGGVGTGDFTSVPGQFQSLIPPRFGMLNGSIVSLPTTNGSINAGTVADSYKNLDRKSMAFSPDSPMQQGILDSNGEMIQPIVYDRLIYANRRSRLLEGADFIRGDLPIFPQNLGWFSPSVQPHIDLRKGIIDNFDKDTANQLHLLQMKSAGKFDCEFEGEGVPPNACTPSYGTFLNPNVGDVQIINFT